MYDTLLINAVVITMDDKRRVLENGAVGIENGKIAFVGSTEEGVKYGAKEVVDCKNHVVMPGFVDAHGHGGHSAFKSIVEDTSYWMPVMTHTYKNYITDEFWYNEGRLSALERLHAGVTTGVCVLGSQPRCDSPVPAMNNAKAYAEVGVKDIVCTGPCHTPWPHRFSRYVNGERHMSEVSYETVLEMTTIDAAKCIGMEKEIGSLEVGKRADVIAINMMNPRLMPRINIIDTLVGNGHPSDVDMVMVDGQFAFRDGKAVAVNEEEVLLKAEQEALETAERAEHLHPFAWPKKPQWGQTKIYFDEERFNMEENRKDGGHY